MRARAHIPVLLCRPSFPPEGGCRRGTVLILRTTQTFFSYLLQCKSGRGLWEFCWLLEPLYILETVHFGHLWWSSNLAPQHLQCGSSLSALTLLVCTNQLAAGLLVLTLSLKKQESSRKTSISALLTMPKPLTVRITINCGKFWKRWEHKTTWPAFWEICRSGSNN